MKSARSAGVVANFGNRPAVRSFGKKQMPSTEDNPSEAGDSPGLPLFRSWPAVYALVLIVFAAVVVALTLFRNYFTGAGS